MSTWRYLQNKRTVIICHSETKDIGSKEYYGCCGECPYVNGKYGESFREDRVWCSCPVPVKKGQKIELIETKKYRVIKETLK
jgi:hypothetical protein